MENLIIQSSQTKIHESGINIILPLALLVLGSIFPGFLFKDFLIGKIILIFGIIQF